MAPTADSCPEADTVDDGLAVAACRGGLRHRLSERGMVTAEYAAGILAAVALALVMLKVVTDGQVFNGLLHLVTSVINKILSKAP